MKSSVIYAVPIGMAVALLTIPVSKCKMSSEVGAADTKVTQMLAMDVGDIPGRQLRVYEIHHVYPARSAPRTASTNASSVTER